MDAPLHAQPDDERDGFRMAKPQKAFAIAFAVLTAALAGCASGLGAGRQEASFGQAAHREEGTVVAARSSTLVDAAPAAMSYTVRLLSGELVSLDQNEGAEIPFGTPVLIEYGASARVIPQSLT